MKDDETADAAGLHDESGTNDDTRNTSGLDPREQLQPWEQEVLELERHWREWAPTHDEAVRDKLGIDSRTYYILLAGLIDDPRFWKADPILADRLRRMREYRAGH
ncbi:MAG: DUF3263 domain-containing protein [Actinomycetaceae bacterium]|nr:DUF3263 domain-containing protein [Arcanobacterium sp.]MDD7504891.1 DUF3263 domain-containing protein [Actinomycetaceae bacterium]MDY6142727.1 DUF3263 domain-containing protein [Arcanobacterium sp.]